VAAALGAPIVAPMAVDGRGSAGPSTVTVHVAGRAGWPTWAPRQAMREVRTARRCARLAASLEPDLVWERHSLFSDAGWKVHAATGARWILEVNAPLVEERARYETLADRAWAEAWERDVLLAAPEIVAVSAALTGWLRDLGCRRVRHVPNGVVPLAGDRGGARARLGLGDELVVGFLGSMKPWHGVERLPALLDRLPGAVGLRVGDGPVQTAHPRLRALGHRNEAEVADLVAAMDVGLAPYAADAPPWFCPLKVLAYRAQGTPVVATDVGDCRLLVGEGGSVLPANADVDALADAVLAWAGRRCAPWVRSWDEVVGEALA
jgi:glycosyltransferase involved in cell wall biosynthesis